MASAALEIRGGTLIRGNGDAPLANATIRVVDRRIAAVWSDSARPPDAEPPVSVYDATGTTVMAGLIDAHCHMTYGESLTQEEQDIWTSVEGRTLRAAWNVQKVLAAGVTGISQPGGSYFIGVAVRDGIKAKKIKGPRMTSAGRYITTSNGLTDWYPDDVGAVEGNIGIRCNTLDEMIAEVRRQVKNRVDFIKLADSPFGEYQSFRDEELKAIVTDILRELEKPGRDPRPAFKTAEFKEGVETLDDLKPGMVLEGVVTNVAAFGAFVDVGVEYLMVDCGPAATHKLVQMGIFPTRVDYLFFTHHHFDHDVDYPCFLLCRWDQAAGKANVVVIGWGLWQRRFGGADALGKQLDFDGRRFTIVGVMPQGFAFPIKQSEFWAPLVVSEQAKRRVGYWLQMVARMKPGVTPVQAQAEMDVLGARLEQQYPSENAGYGIFVNPLENHVAGNVKTPLLVLLGAVALVLLIACVNVAGLFLARAEARGRRFVKRLQPRRPGGLGVRV